MEPLVSTQWLHDHLDAPDLRVLDATFFLPADGRDARAEYTAAHIPGALFFDLAAIVDRDHPVPGMLPTASDFTHAMRALGIGKGDRIVVYDNSPHHSAARAWWMLKSFGARDVAILDGGLPKWLAEGRPTDTAAVVPAVSSFTGTLDPSLLADKAMVAASLGSGRSAIVDARGPQRFAGTDPEPRPGVVPGHIPGSRNLPQARLFNPDNSFKRGDELRRAFEDVGVDLSKPMITTCGSGVTAAVLLFGAHLLGKNDVRLYDGSWAEWGSDPSTPKATGTG